MWLCLDTSTLTVALALVDRAGGVVASRKLGPHGEDAGGRKQSELLPAALGELLAAHGLTPGAVEGFVVGLGPGSFTGLRVGLAAVKGLSYVVKRPVVGASSLAAMALDGPAETELMVVATVKKGEVYLGRYRHHGGRVEALALETSMTVEALGRAACDATAAVVLGPALADLPGVLEAKGVPADRLRSDLVVPSAHHLARLVVLPERYEPARMFRLEPHYLRGSGAEENPRFPPLAGVSPVARRKD